MKDEHLVYNNHLLRSTHKVSNQSLFVYFKIYMVKRNL